MDQETTSETRRLALDARHAAHGAQNMGVCGWKVPAHFGDPEAEYKALCEGVGLLDAGFLAVVRATGADHVDYLNRRLSQRVIESEPGTVLRANQLSGEGRMEADLEVLRIAETESLLIAPPAIPGDMLQALADKYVFTEEATFTDESRTWGCLALVGPRRAAVLEAAGLPDPGEGGLRQKHDAVVFASSFFPETTLVLVPREQLESEHGRLKGEVQQLGGSLVGFLAFDTRRVEAGIPWWGIDLGPSSIPLEADLMNAIHTNKGCYPGQETIAKILNLGHPARKLVGIVWDTEDPLPGGTALFLGDREVGRLTSSTYSPRTGKAIGLAMVRWAQREPGIRLKAEAVEGVTCPLPFE